MVIPHAGKRVKSKQGLTWQLSQASGVEGLLLRDQWCHLGPTSSLAGQMDGGIPPPKCRASASSFGADAAWLVLP